MRLLGENYINIEKILREIFIGDVLNSSFEGLISLNRVMISKGIQIESSIHINVAASIEDTFN